MERVGETVDINAKWERALVQFRVDVLRNEQFQKLLRFRMGDRLPAEYFDPQNPEVQIEPVQIMIEDWHEAGLRVSYNPPGGSKPMAGTQYSVNEFVSIGSFGNVRGNIFYGLEGNYDSDGQEFSLEENTELRNAWQKYRDRMRGQFSEDEWSQLPILVDHYVPDWALEMAPQMASFGKKKLYRFPLPYET